MHNHDKTVQSKMLLLLASVTAIVVSVKPDTQTFQPGYEYYAHFRTYSSLLQQIKGYKNLDETFRNKLEGMLDFEVTEVSNLREYLKTLDVREQEDRQCFTHLVNYGRVNLPHSLSQPILIIQPIPTIKRQLGRYSKGQLQIAYLVTRQLGAFNQWRNFTQGTAPFTCVASKFFRIDNLYTCSTNYLLREVYSAFSKPWMCEVFIKLLPPYGYKALRQYHSYILKSVNTNFKGIMRYMYSTGLHDQLYAVPPSSLLQLHISITLPQQASENEIISKLEYQYEDAQYGKCVAVVMWWNATLGSRNDMIEPRRMRVISGRIIEPRSYYGASLNISQVMGQSGVQLVLNVARQAEKQGRVAWAFTTSNEHRIEHTLSRCRFNDKLVRNEKIVADHFHEAYANLWWSILGNFSFHVGHDQVCNSDSGKRQRDKWLNSKLTVHCSAGLTQEGFYHALVMNRLDSLRFLTCGIRGKDSLAFKELLGTYQPAVWFWLVIFVVIITVAIRYPQQRNRITASRLIISCLKSLVEQGDPFPGCTFRKPHTSVVIIPFIFVAIVLSNAYRNENVFRMVQPRKPLLYSTYEHLMADDFTLYSRGMLDRLEHYFSNMTFHTRLIQNTDHELSFQESEYYPMNIDTRIRSELLIIFSELASVNQNSSTYLQLEKLLHSSRMTDEILKMTRGLYDASKVLANFPEVYGYELAPVLLDMQKLLFIDKLKECEKVAVLLPYHRAIEYLEVLRTKSPHKYISTSIGDQSYTSHFLRFHFLGPVPPHYYENLNRLKVAGIWNWRGQLIESIIAIRESFNKGVHLGVTRASIHGNILVIFIVFLVGLGISFFIFSLKAGCLKLYRHRLELLKCWSRLIKVLIHVKSRAIMLLNKKYLRSIKFWKWVLLSPYRMLCNSKTCLKS